MLNPNQPNNIFLCYFCFFLQWLSCVGNLHNFQKAQFKDHSAQVWTKSVQHFLRQSFFEFSLLLVTVEYFSFPSLEMAENHKSSTASDKCQLTYLWKIKTLIFYPSFLITVSIKLLFSVCYTIADKLCHEHVILKLI